MTDFLRIGLMIIILCCAAGAEGQKKKTNEGYFITLQNDTILCVFKDRNWKRQPFEFGIEANNKDSVLHPDGIMGLSIISKGTNYVSRQIKPAKYIDNIQNAINATDPEFDTVRTAFLKVLHTGTLNLYLYFDRLNRKHFFAENKDNFLELYSHYYSDFGGNRYSQPVANLNKQFEFALKVLMTPCRTIFSIIESIQLNEDNLKGLFEIYDKCIASKNED